MLSDNASSSPRSLRWQRRWLLVVCLCWLLSLALFLASIFSQYTFALTGSKMHRAILGNDWAGSALLVDTLYFAAAVIGLYLFAAILCWVAAESARTVLRYHHKYAFRFIGGYTVLWIVTTVLAAAAAFPHSGTMGKYHDMAMSGVGFLTLANVLLAIVFLSLLPAGIVLQRRARAHPGLSSAAVVLFLIVSIPTWIGAWGQPGAKATGDRPNIIFLGIDSLRIDHLQAGGGSGFMPHVDSLLDGMVVFRDVVTPLPRTSPAWTSLLTGLYPASHGAAFNLSPAQAVDTSQSFARSLSDQGYNTIYAADETRFSNKDDHYGFKTQVGPRMGAGDFLFGVMADTPLVLLVLNSRLGQWLFPYVHANRAVAYSYHPRVFNRLLERSLRGEDAPALLVTHLCLPHWPFSWADPLPQELLDLAAEQENKLPLYRHSLRAVDDQVSEIMGLLERQGWLDNAFVFIVSDHGEGFGIPGESVRKKQRLSDGSWGRAPGYAPAPGHGTTLEAPDHYQVVFAVQHYLDGEPQYKPKVRDERISLVDIRPTLDDLFGLDATGHAYDGQSFSNLIHGEEANPELWRWRPVFMETGFNTPAVMAGVMDEEEIFSESYIFYDVEPDSGRLVIRADMAHEVMALKEFSVLLDQWQMIATPNLANGYSYQIIHRPSGRWASYPAARGIIAPEAVEQAMWAELDAYIERAWQRYREAFDAPLLKRPDSGSVGQ